MDETVGSAEKGVLYVIATPIGNLRDMTFRAVDILKSVDVVAAEDTRHTAGLLSFFQIRTRLVSCHEHNEAFRADRLVDRLRSGASIALVSNAGTPAVSDPGYRIVSAAVAQGIRVIPLPGACAAVAALSASGLPSDMFFFAGFAPRKQGKRDRLLLDLSGRRETLVFFESPVRLRSFLNAAACHLGDRYAVVARELTKMHEEFIRGRLSEITRQLADRKTIRGEVTVLIAGRTDSPSKDPAALEDDIRKSLLSENLSTSRLAARLADRYNGSKNEMYQEILTVKASMEEEKQGRNSKGDFSDGQT